MSYLNLSVNSNSTGKISRYLFLILLMSLQFLMSSPTCHNMIFGQGASYKSSSHKKKIRHGAIYSPNGDFYLKIFDNKRLVCFKIFTNENKEDQRLWEKEFDFNIANIGFDRKSGDRIYVDTGMNTWRGDAYKGNFTDIKVFYAKLVKNKIISAYQIVPDQPTESDDKNDNPSTAGTNQNNIIEFVEGFSYQSRSHKEKRGVTPFASISPNGDFYIFRDGEKHLVCFKTSIGMKRDDKKLWEKDIDSRIEKIRFDPKSGDHIYVVTTRGILNGDIREGKFVYIMNEKNMRDIDLSPGGELYATSIKKGLLLGNQKTGDVSLRISRANKKKNNFLYFISENQLLTVGDNNLIKVWNLNTGKTIRNNTVRDNNSPNSNIQAAVMTFDKKYLFVGINDFIVPVHRTTMPRASDIKNEFKLKIIDTDNLKIEEIKDIKGINNHFRDLSISADNKFAAVLTKDKTVKIWDLKHSKDIKTFSVQPYSDVEFGPLGKTFIMTTEAGKIRRMITKGISAATFSSGYIRKKIRIISSRAPLITKKHKGITIAVEDFSSTSGNTGMVKEISNAFKGKIINYTYINTLDQDEMNKILDAHAFQHSGLTSPHKAVEIGKILNAQKLITGQINVLDSTLVVSIKVLDLESGRVDGIRSVKCESYSPENITDITEVLLDTLIEK